MTGATQALQQALVAALGADPHIAAEITGIYDGVPPRADFPYISLDCGTSTDWSHKTGQGREHRLALTIWSDGETIAKLYQLMTLAEEVIEAVPNALDGHKLVSIFLQRSRVLRDPAGPWAGQLEYRARTQALTD